MSSIGSLSTAISGLFANQRGLQVTAQNLSNVNTPGYVRQQTLLKDSNYMTIGNNATSIFQKGLGADVQAIRQVRDRFLDEAYRTEVGRQGFYGAQCDVVNELEEIFGELEGESFSDILNDFWNAVNELAKYPEGLETRGAFVQSAVAFVNRSNLIMQQIDGYQKNLNQQIKDMVSEINTTGDQIKKLNDEICRYEVLGDRANDLRDERNRLLDRLSEIVDISYYEDSNSKVNILLEGMEFVSDGHVSHIALAQAEPKSLLVKPVWEEYAHDVFNFSSTISPENKNDKGALKGLLLARGTGMANYTDRNDPNYATAIEPSIIMRTMVQFDTLVHDIVTFINDTVSPNIGTPPVLDPDGPVGLDGSRGTEIFKRINYDRYTSGDQYIEEDANDYYKLYTAGNIEINPAILQDYDRIAISDSEEGDIADSSIINKILEKWDTPFASLEPSGSAKMNYNEYYASLISEMGHFGNVAINIRDNQKLMVTQIDNQRGRLMGVSSDEELSSMMKFQYAYNASARVVSLVDEMIEQIVTSLGLVGR